MIFTFKNALAYSSMESVLFGTEYNFGAFTEGRREKKQVFFRGGRRTTRKKNLFFWGDRRLKAPKLDLAQRELIPYY